MGLPNLIVFPNRIRKLREEAGWKQRAFAKAAAISTGHLSYIERGVRRPGDDKLAQIARILKVPPADLVVGPDSADEYDLWVELMAELHQEATPTLLLGSRLREFRLSQSLSMHELAKRCSALQPWQIRDFEVGGRQPGPEEMKDLAAAFGFPTVDRFRTALNGLVIELADDLGSDEGRTSIMRGINRALRAFDGTSLKEAEAEARAPRRAAKSRSLDGDLLADQNAVLAGSVIRLVRLATPRDHTLCVVMNGNAPAGIGRMVGGVVPGPGGLPLLGDIWRVESINFMQRVF